MEQSEWLTPEHALEYRARSDAVPHRTEGEAVVHDSCLSGSGGSLTKGPVEKVRPAAAL